MRIFKPVDSDAWGQTQSVLVISAYKFFTLISFSSNDYLRTMKYIIKI